MEFRKNDLVTLEIEDCGIDGEGIGKAVDTAQNDDRHQESPESIFESVPAFFAGGFFPGWFDIVFLCFQHYYDYQCHAH